MQRILLILLFTAVATGVFAQKAKLEGKVIDPVNNEPVPFANIIVSGTTIGAISDIDAAYFLLLLLQQEWS